MSTFQSTSVRILTDFDDFLLIVTLFHNFLGFRMILTSKYCDSDEEFIKNSPMLNDLKIPKEIPKEPIQCVGFITGLN